MFVGYSIARPFCFVSAFVVGAVRCANFYWMNLNTEQRRARVMVEDQQGKDQQVIFFPIIQQEITLTG
jgi:hypothetical protein